MKRVDLERVPIQFRCPPGQQPQAYEVRCRVCSTRLVGFFEGDAFELLRDQASALESLGNRDRENLEDTVQRTLERSQNK